MSKEKVNEAVILFENLEYADKLNAYQKVFSLGTFGSNELNNKLIYFSLLALCTKKLREKDAQVTPLSILMRITNQIKDNSAFYQFLEASSIITEDFMYGCTVFDTCGLKSSEEILNKLKEIVSSWRPF